MTSTLDASRAARTQANVLGWASEGPGARRDRKRIVGGVALVLVCGWLSAVLFFSAGSREEALVVARPVDRFAEVSRGDVEVVRVAADSDVASIPAGELDEVVGRPAAVALVPGSLLSADQLLDAGDRLVSDGEAVVGATLSSQDAPTRLVAGDGVDVVVRPPSGDPLEVATLRGWVLDAADADVPGRDDVRVSVVVPAESVALVSAAAAEDRVSLAVRGTS